MKSISLLYVAIFLSLASLCQAQSWSLQYSNEVNKDNNKVAFYNHNSDSDFAEDSPYGPMSFRVIGEKLWVLDSVGGKLKCFDKSGKLIKNIAVPVSEDFCLLEDFAFEGKDLNNPTFVWIANAADCLVSKISLSDGKIITKIGGNGNESGKILQVNQLEVDIAGRLYVADIARSKILIFSSTGSFLREVNWQSSGLVVDNKANLHLLDYTDNFGYAHKIYSPKGQLLKNIHLGLVKNTNAKILSVDKNDTIILSMIPKEGFKGSMLLNKINNVGIVEEKLEYIPPSTMNRDIFINGDKIYQVEADFESAPNTNFIVKSINWAKKVANEAK